jgi:outer membrane murein-binding lipoprotein Lpp
MTLCAILLLTGCENKQVKNPVAAQIQQIESPLQNTAEGMAKACLTKAPGLEPCRLHSRQPKDVAQYLPHD